MSDPVTRLNAALEGRYAIERELGEGGMATVYLAKDLKHNRNVALKVLKPELAAVVGAERFLGPVNTKGQFVVYWGYEDHRVPISSDRGLLPTSARQCEPLQSRSA